MKNRVKKVLMLTGILCVMGITLCACQGTKEVSDENQNQEEIGGTDSIAIQEINKGYQRQKTNQHSRKDESERKPEQYHAGAGVII